jgi:hypothetical protein
LSGGHGHDGFWVWMSESVCIACWIGAWAKGVLMHNRAPGKARIDSATASLCLLCVRDRTGEGRAARNHARAICFAP